MTYHLGIDLGTTYSSAAIVRDGRSEAVMLGHGAAAVASLVWLGGDGGETLIGDSAARRGQREPSRLARQFKRRFGDEVPLVLGGTPVSADQLMARLLAEVVRIVTEREGEPPASVALTHPANWGAYRREMLAEVARTVGLTDVVFLTEPEAAARYYAAAGKVHDGETVIVYDLGGGTFDVALLRQRGTEFEFLGDADGVERLGGIDFDRAVLEWVRNSLDPTLMATDSEDGAQAMQRLLDECTSAKEALSTASETDVAVTFPGLHTSVRLTRREFEDLIRPSLLGTIDAVRRALDSAGVEPDQVARVLLVGGSSRIPLVAELVGHELGREVAVDAHPKLAVALGAALSAADRASPSPVADLTPGPPPVADDAALAPSPPTTPGAPASGGRRRVLIGVGAVVAALVVGAIAVLIATSGGDDEEAATTSDPVVGAPATTASGAPGSSPPGSAPVDEPVIGPAVVDVGSEPDGVGYDDGSAWVSTASGDLLRVDGATGEVAVRIPIEPGIDEMAFTDDLIVVAGATQIHLVNPSSGVAVGALTMPGVPEGVVADFGAVWISGSIPADAGSTGYIARVDIEAEAVEVVSELPFPVDEMTRLDGALWTFSNTDPVVLRVDPGTGATAQFELPAKGQGIGAGFGAVWVSMPELDGVARVNPGTGEVEALIRTDPRPDEVAIGTELVWVTLDESAQVVGIDPETNEVVEVVDVGTDPDAIASGSSALWVANRGDLTVSIVPVDR